MNFEFILSAYWLGVKSLTNEKLKHQGMNCDTNLIKHLGLPDRRDFIEEEHIQEVVCLGTY